MLICCICLKPIPAKGTWTGGNSAEPVVDGGRCCDECDRAVVIPMRLRRLHAAEAYDRWLAKHPEYKR